MYHTIITCMAYGQILRTDIKASNPELQKITFSRIGARLWNEIPRNLRELSRKSIKARIKNELLSMLDKENAFLQIHEIIHKLKSFN